MAEGAGAPLVTVGMPVHNGERFLVEAIQSILGQSVGDLELVITDDDSTDATPEICRSFAARDPRVRYLENGRKLGITENHNRVVELARGRFFHWMGADDSHDPLFLERCLAALAEAPAAPLAATGRRMIDEHGNLLGIEADDWSGAAASRPSQRLDAALFGFPRCSAMHGLVRMDHLKRTSLMLPFYGSDRTFVVETALMGPFAYVAEPVFHNREHQGRYSQNARVDNWHLLLHSATRPGQSTAPTWRGVASWVRAVARLVPDPVERLACYGVIARWVAGRRSLALLLGDAVILAWPKGAIQFLAWKRRHGLVSLIPSWRRASRESR